MPPCKKQLILEKDGSVIILYCCDSEGHEGDCQAHVQGINIPNKVTKKDGVTIVIKFPNVFL